MNPQLTFETLVEWLRLYYPGWRARREAYSERLVVWLPDGPEFRYDVVFSRYGLEPLFGEIRQDIERFLSVAKGDVKRHAFANRLLAARVKSRALGSLA